jgi:hypothetical protein
MDAMTMRALTAMFLATLAVFVRSAHAAPLGKSPKPAKPPHGPSCTITGTNGSDVILGSAGVDVICGLGGNDQIDGGGGRDTIFAAAGDDVILARDGARDVIDGGPGRDSASIDRKLDKVVAVERVN